MAEPIATPDTLAIYIHWPFCRSLCPYCDFNSHIGEQVDHARWRRALLEELTHYAELAGPRRVTSLFFGGGTPSLMEPETAAAVIDLAGQHFALATPMLKSLWKPIQRRLKPTGWRRSPRRVSTG